MSAENRGPIYTLIYVAVISAVFTGGIMALYAVSQPTIQRNAALFEQKALVDAFNIGDVQTLPGDEIAAIFSDRIHKLDNVTDSETGATFVVYALDSTDNPTAIAFTITGTGFWARIDGFLAVTPDLNRIVGITFLKHQETPGLGGRITERAWRESFRGLDISPPPADEPILIIAADAPADQADRCVDAISGATGTSSAVEEFLNEQIAAFRRAWQAEDTQ